MHPRARVSGQQRVAGHNRFLSRPGPTRQAQLRGTRAFVGDRTDGQPGLLGVLGDQHTQAGGVFESAAHDQRVVHADPVVGEHPHRGDTGIHHAHLGEFSSGEPDRDGADGMYVDQTDLLSPVPDVVGDHRTVGHRMGVGHREHRRVATQRCCRRTGLDVLGIFAARLAQVGVQVDQPRQQHVIGGIDDIRRIGDGQSGPDVSDLVVVDEHVDPFALAVQPHSAQ